MGRNRIVTVLLILVSFVGLSLVLYPMAADMWNNRHVSRVISSYAEELADVGDDRYAEMWLAAQEFNERINAYDEYELTEELLEEYYSVLNLSGVGVMGYIEIPKINVQLPIYHGSDESVLQIAVGHLEWSSLPIGGSGTHSVLSGHRGLSSARLFTDLPQLSVGDIFYIRVLNELFTYEVDQLKTVLPTELDDLQIEEGKDYCTLVTCTPYAINTHRLLVRGHRISNTEETRVLLVTADAVQIEPLIVAPVLAIPILILLIILVFVRPDETERQRIKRKYNVKF